MPTDKAFFPTLDISAVQETIVNGVVAFMTLKKAGCTDVKKSMLVVPLRECRCPNDDNSSMHTLLHGR